jgi:hypothetical protein
MEYTQLANSYEKDLHTWSAINIGSGLATVVGGVVFRPKTTKTAVAAVGGGVTAAITAYLTAYSYEAKAKKYRVCSDNLKKSLSRFQADWGNATGLKGNSNGIVIDDDYKKFMIDLDVLADQASCPL